MTAHAALELRILSGLHAGAREPLGDADAVLGSVADCDFILKDLGMAPRQGRLEFGESGWHLQLWGPDEDEPSESFVMAPGSLHRVGPVVVSVDEVDAPWPNSALVRELLDESVLAESSQAVGMFPVPTSLSGAHEDSPLVTVQADEADEFAPSQARPEWLLAPRPSSGRMRLFLGAALGVIVLGLAWVLIPPGSLQVGQTLAGLPSVVEPVAASRPTAGGEALLAQIAQAVDALALGQPFEVRTDASGRPVVKMGVLNAADHERLALALASFRPRPGLSVISETELSEAVSAALAVRAQEWGTQLKAANVGGGRFRLEGRLASASQRDELLAELQAALPAAVLESRLTIPEDLAAHMLEDLQSANVASVDGSWSEGQLRLDVCVDRGDVPRWEALLASVARRYPVPFTATLCADGGMSTSKAMALLPFRLRSVVSGDTPYVVMDDGARLMLGGKRGEWRLASVDARSVVFESDTRRAVVPR